MRDAALRLSDAGLVTIERNRGIRIHQIGVTDVRDIFELRILLEVPAVRWAAVYADAELRGLLDDDAETMSDAARHGDAELFLQRDIAMHERLLGASGNSRLVAEVHRLREATVLADASTFGRSRTLEEVHAEHLPILAAVSAGDADKAAAAMTAHLGTTGLLLMRQVAERTGEPMPAEWPRRL